MKTKIQNQINRLNRIATETGRIDEETHLAICDATQWLANGGYSRYSNQDFDILQRLVSAESR